MLKGKGKCFQGNGNCFFVTFRQWIKYTGYGLVGAFPYFGARVYFPRGSSAFGAACAQGIFEAENVRVLQRVCKPSTWMFDVGANLGLMALPVLRSVPDSTVISFEPSPNSLPWLRRTIAQSNVGDRWQLVEKAVAASPGTASFSMSATAEGLYDGLLHTRRTLQGREVEVELTTLELEWKRFGCPAVSTIKIDVEGGGTQCAAGGKVDLPRRRQGLWCCWNGVIKTSRRIQYLATRFFGSRASTGLFTVCPA